MTIESIAFTTPTQDMVLVQPGNLFMAWPLPETPSNDLERVIVTWLEQGNTPAPVPLEQVKADAMRAVDEAAERARLQYITPGAGQALEYETTRAEAAHALAVMAGNGTLDPTDYPMLEAERMALAAVGVTVTLEAVAQSVQSSWQAWLMAGAAIKQERRRAKLAIEAAASAEDVQTILAGLGF